MLSNLSVTTMSDVQPFNTLLSWKPLGFGQSLGTSSFSCIETSSVPNVSPSLSGSLNILCVLSGMLVCGAIFIRTWVGKPRFSVLRTKWLASHVLRTTWSAPLLSSTNDKGSVYVLEAMLTPPKALLLHRRSCPVCDEDSFLAIE